MEIHPSFVEKCRIELGFIILHVCVLGDLFIRIPERLRAKNVDPKRVINIGPCESNAWTIPRSTTLINVLAKANIRGKIAISVVEPHVQVEFEQAFEQALEQASEQA